MTRRFLIALFILIASFGCATNPVTGQRELHLVSEAQEIKIGRQNYLPARQSQGGRYEADPGLAAYVGSVGQRLAKVSDRPHLPYEFSVLNNSVPNAWALPGGKIAVNRGLLTELNNEAELAAVLGHEIVHAAARHGAKGMERGMILQAGMIGLGAALSDKEYSGLIVGGAGLGAALISTKFTRDQESEADHYGMIYMARAGYAPQAAVNLQKTFVRLFKDRKPNWLEGLFATHPPSLERVKANEETAGTLPAGGKLGKEEFQERVAGLKRSKPAYKALEKGRKALEKGDTALALTKAGEAIRIEPREALFYELMGDAKAKKRRYQEALDQYNETIKKNKGFFRFFLKRGLVKEKLGDISGARRDLQRSNALLPTAIAHNVLGNFALTRGQSDLALEHFRIAAASGSEAGRRAGISLTRLELPRNPAKYLAVRKALNRGGMIVLRVQNRSGVAVRDVAVALSLMGMDGRVLAADTVIFPFIPAGSQSALVSRIGPLREPDQLRRGRIRILRARIAD